MVRFLKESCFYFNMEELFTFTRDFGLFRKYLADHCEFNDCCMNDDENSLELLRQDLETGNVDYVICNPDSNLGPGYIRILNLEEGVGAFDIFFPRNISLHIPSLFDILSEKGYDIVYFNNSHPLVQANVGEIEDSYGVTFDSESVDIRVPNLNYTKHFKESGHYDVIDLMDLE